MSNEISEGHEIYKAESSSTGRVIWYVRWPDLTISSYASHEDALRAVRIGERRMMPYA